MQNKTKSVLANICNKIFAKKIIEQFCKEETEFFPPKSYFLIPKYLQPDGVSL